MRNFNEIYREAQDLALLHRGYLPGQKLRAFFEISMCLKKLSALKGYRHYIDTITTIKSGPENFHLYVPNLIVFKNTRLNFAGEHIITPAMSTIRVKAFTSVEDHQDPAGRRTIARVTFSARISMTNDKDLYIPMDKYSVRNFQNFQRTMSRTFVTNYSKYTGLPTNPHTWMAENIHIVKQQISTSGLNLESFNIEKI